jgi:conjugative transfer signal peptidase TraF
MRIIKFAAAGAGLLALGLLYKPTPRFVWNATASAPIGLYLLTGSSPALGDLVLVTTPPSVQRLASDRRYLPMGVPLVKRIAGLSGDEICATGEEISINKRLVALRKSVDSKGRPMPFWSGCRTLSNEVFLLMEDVPASFDGRYFGPVLQASIIGKLRPLWTQ